MKIDMRKKNRNEESSESAARQSERKDGFVFPRKKCAESDETAADYGVYEQPAMAEEMADYDTASGSSAEQVQDTSRKLIKTVNLETSLFRGRLFIPIFSLCGAAFITG